MAHDVTQFVRVKKLKGAGIVRIAARHNLRELQAELGALSHIDAARTNANCILAGGTTAGEVVELADRLMASAGVMVNRKDGVRAIETLFSLPAESQIDVDAFFADALQWVRDSFAVPVLSAVFHKDEAAPHMHVLLLPLVNGRMAGSDLMGNRTRLQGLQASFFEQVGLRHGLVRPKAAKRLNHAVRRKCAELAYTAIVSDSDLLLRPEVEQALLDALGRHPEPLLSALGLPMPTTSKPAKSFTEIMTRPCKPEARERIPIGFDMNANPIGFESQPAGKSKPYVSVGFASAPPPVSPSPHQEPGLVTFTRISDDDEPAENWDTDLGECRALPQPNRRETLLVGTTEAGS